MNIKNSKGLLYLSVTIFLFSTFEVVSRTLVGKIDPVQITFIRYFFGGIILLPFAWLELKQKQIRPGAKDILGMALLGLLLVGISMSFLQYGINETRANLAAAIFSANPLFVALAAAIILKEPLKANKMLGLGAGLAGVAIIFLSSDDGGQIYLRGLIFLLLAAATFGLYTVLAKKYTLKFGSLTMNVVTFLFGSVFLIPVLLWQGLPVFWISKDIFLQMAYISVIVTGLAYYTYFKGLALTDTSKGSMVFFVKPPLSCLLAAVTLGEPMTLSFALGVAVVLASIYLVQRKPSSKNVS